MKKLRVLALVDENLVPPDDAKGHDVVERAAWKMEFDVVHTLREQGHEPHALGVQSDLGVDPARPSPDFLHPHIAFNLLEEFPWRRRVRPARSQLPRAAPRCPTPAATRAASPWRATRC